MRFPVVVVALLGFGCGPPPPGEDAVGIAVPYELATLDPHAANTVSHYALLSNVYEPLVALDREGRIMPSLAVSWESPDLDTWVFHLRPNASFHGGGPLTADDVVFSIERLRRDPSLGMRVYLASVVQARALDPLTVEVRTARPNMMLLNKLSFVLIVPKDSTRASLDARAEGTGPYALAAWRRDQRELRLVRNPRYQGPRPAFARAVFALAREPEEAVSGLLEGRYQLVQFDSKALAPRVASSPRHRVVAHDNVYVKYLGFHLAPDVAGPLRDRRVREAIHVALDRARLVAPLPTFAVPASQPVPRFILGFDPAIPVPDPDAERARRLLREAGVPRGFPASLYTRRILAQAAADVAEQLAPIGIRLRPEVIPEQAFFAGVRRFPLWLSRWGCVSGDASDFLESYVHTPDPGPALGEGNYSGYSNQALDRAIEASARIEAGADRRRALQSIMRTLMEDLVVVPLYADQDVYGVERALAWRPRNDSYIRVAEIAPARP